MRKKLHKPVNISFLSGIVPIRILVGIAVQVLLACVFGIFKNIIAFEKSALGDLLYFITLNNIRTPGDLLFRS
jgi:hypothetical protein